MLPKPVTCISIASPEVGNIAFRQAVAVLEKERKLRCLRVVNFADPITVGDVVPPFLAIASMFCCKRAIASMFCCKRMLYEHVGVRLVLFPAVRDTFTLSYKKVRWFHKRVLLLLELTRHFKDVVARLFVCLVLCMSGLLCKVGSELLENHMCERYMQRLTYYKRIEKLHLNELYNEKLKAGLYHACEACTSFQRERGGYSKDEGVAEETKGRNKELRTKPSNFRGGRSHAGGGKTSGGNIRDSKIGGGGNSSGGKAGGGRSRSSINSRRSGGGNSGPGTNAKGESPTI